MFGPLPEGASDERSGLSATSLAIVGVLALGVSIVLAGGPPVVNETDHVVNVTETFIDVHPCSGAPI